jgi:chromo domain-containing protein 1
MKLFLAKIDMLRQFAGPPSPWQEVGDACLLWRLCVRPELMEHLFMRCKEQAAQLDAGNPDITATAEMYTVLSETNYIEQDSPVQPLSAISDKYPVMSERRIVAEEQPLDYFNTVSRSQEEANLRIIRYYAGLQTDMRRDYRHFFVVHTEPFAPCVRQWKQEIQSIADVITPEQCINELTKDGLETSRGQLFDFCERYMSKSVPKQANATTIEHGTNGQTQQATTS